MCINIIAMFATAIRISVKRARFYIANTLDNLIENERSETYSLDSCLTDIMSPIAVPITYRRSSFMPPFSDMAKDKIFIVKVNGTRLGPYYGALSLDSCTIFNKMLDIEHGDTIARPLPNGKEEHYTVLRADFREDFHGIPGGYDLTLQKEQQIFKNPSSVVNNVSISHSTGFQVGDNNVQHIKNALLELERAIDAQDASPEAKSDVKSKLKSVLQHPLTVAILGAAVGKIGG